MTSIPIDLSSTSLGQIAADSGLRCLKCEYNLTGIASERCPECGQAIDWKAVTHARDLRARWPGTHWELLPWMLKPLGFILTATEAAGLPWRLAHQLLSRRGILAALGFLIVCLAGAAFEAVSIQGATPTDRGLAAWVIGVACQVILQTLVFGLVLRPHFGGRPFRFWFAATCYTSYPLLLEGGLTEPPHILRAESNIWPFSLWGGDAEVLTSVLYHLWWAGLACLSFVSSPRRSRWRIVLLILAVPVLTYASSYTGCYLAEQAF